MASESAATYLVIGVQSRRFAIPLRLVAGVFALAGDDAAFVQSQGLLAWQGFYCQVSDFLGFSRKAEPGATAVVLELEGGRVAFICDPHIDFRQVDRRLALPQSLIRFQPRVREVFLDGDSLVHCYAPESEAA